MGLKEVERAIRRAVAVMGNEHFQEVLHEAGTRYAIIDPILRALDWNLADPGQCRVEEWRSLEKQQKVADYVLRKGDVNVVLIEAKGFNKTRLNGWREEDQLGGFHKDGNRVMLGVLTNGQSWYFYNMKEENPFGEPRAPDVFLSNERVHESSRDLSRRLGKRNVFRRLG